MLVVSLSVVEDLKGLELTYKRLIKNKIDRNLDLVISKNGKVMHVDPRDFQK